MPEDMSEYMPEDMSDRMPEDMSEYMPEDMPDRMPDRMPEDMSDRVPEDMPDRMPEDLPDRMPEDMPDHMPEDMPDRMPNRMSEDMSDRMPEDLPVRKCINVMVGITRSKVIGFDRGSCKNHCCPHWACLGLNFHARRPPHRTKLGISPVPTLRHVKLARVRRKLRPSWAQARSCSAQLKAKDGQVWPHSPFGWAKYGPLLSSLSYSLGAGSSRSDLNKALNNQIKTYLGVRFH